MSKGKKVIGVLLAIIVLAGIVFGIYLYLRKNEGHQLTEERAINLVGETSVKLDSAINIMGMGMENSSSKKQVNSVLSSDSGIATQSDEDYLEDYESCLYNLISDASYINMMNYAFTQEAVKKIEFGETYVAFNGNPCYMTFSKTSDKVVFEIMSENVTDTEQIHNNSILSIGYNSKKDTVSEVNVIRIFTDFGNEENSITIYASSINFELKTFSIYDISLVDEFSDVILGKAFKNMFIDATLSYDDIKSYIRNEESHVEIFMGNIANSITDMHLSSHNNTKNIKYLFDTYSTNIKNLNLIAENNSKITKDSVVNINSLYYNMLYTSMAESNKYKIKVADGQINFYRIPEANGFDGYVIGRLKTTTDNVDAEFSGVEYFDHVRNISFTLKNGYTLTKLKEDVNAFYSYYNLHKDDKDYIPLLLGKCESGEGIELPANNLLINMSTDYGYTNSVCNFDGFACVISFMTSEGDDLCEIAVKLS